MTLCADPARKTIYDRISQYLFEPPQTVKGRCTVCGAMDIEIIPVKAPSTKVTPSGVCVAQAALTSKRSTAVEGSPLIASSEELPGRYSMTDIGTWLIVDAERAVSACKVRPIRELPENTEVLRPKTEAGSFEGALSEIINNPKPPMVIAKFSQKATMPMSITHCGNEIAINGNDTVEIINADRLATLISLYRKFGIKPVTDAAAIRSAIGAGKQQTKDLQKLKTANPALFARFRDLSSGKEPEVRLAKIIVNNEITEANNKETK